MRSSLLVRITGSCMTLASLVAAPSAQADVTVVGRYTFVNGETAKRPSYFAAGRIRISTPDGREVMFDTQAGRVTVIDHRRKVYWDGPVTRADSIMDVAAGSRWEFALAHDEGRLQADWEQAMQFPPDSIRLAGLERERQLAGFACDGWRVSAGPFMEIERWTAPSLPVESTGDTTEAAVLEAVLDPVGRAVLSLFWESYETAGLCLAGSLTLRTPDRQGTFRWEAVKVSTAGIPESAWTVPQGYRRATLTEPGPLSAREN